MRKFCDSLASRGTVERQEPSVNERYRSQAVILGDPDDRERDHGRARMSAAAR
jgi:hypothetical protein